MSITEIRRSWFLPSWKNLTYGEIPAKHPRMKVEFTGVVNLSTQDKGWKHETVLWRVAYDMMRRLRKELGCDMAPIDGSSDGEAWIEIRNGEPIGCVTVCSDMGKRMLLGAWVKPGFRRTGVMNNLWNHVVSKHGVLKIVRPSPSMIAWMQKHRVKKG
jgi:hypothetical protein